MEGAQQHASLGLQGGHLSFSTAAAPIVYRDMTIGAIYIRDRTRPRALLMNSGRTCAPSLVLADVLAVSAFSRVLTARIGALLGPSGWWARGRYRLQPAGKDELAHLGEEFNSAH